MDQFGEVREDNEKTSQQRQELEDFLGQQNEFAKAEATINFENFILGSKPELTMQEDKLE